MRQRDFEAAFGDGAQQRRPRLAAGTLGDEPGTKHDRRHERLDNQVPAHRFQHHGEVGERAGGSAAILADLDAEQTELRKRVPQAFALASKNLLALLERMAIAQETVRRVLQHALRLAERQLHGPSQPQRLGDDVALNLIRSAIDRDDARVQVVGSERRRLIEADKIIAMVEPA